MTYKSYMFQKRKEKKKRIIRVLLPWVLTLRHSYDMFIDIRNESEHINTTHPYFKDVICIESHRRCFLRLIQVMFIWLSVINGIDYVSWIWINLWSRIFPSLWKNSKNFFLLIYLLKKIHNSNADLLKNICDTSWAITSKRNFWIKCLINDLFNRGILQVEDEL